MFDLMPFDKRRRNMLEAAEKVFRDNFFSNLMTDNFFKDSPLGSIRADIKENNKEYIVEAEVPGFTKDEINLEYKNDHLYLTINQNEEINEERDNYIRRERRVGRISRSFYIPNVKQDEITAKAPKNGLLKVILPKEKPSKGSKKIDIQ
ncbi:Hsp20/alpha crystallin family protein [Paramaledivibacter caminithermalis]|jgi:HSP20 family protein|uniref:HSP20 family protein n=1 Tax=Paramaledivibacter caminithermalis (strain DSM 15212 / CIP 107654 / DViRD3) TaxID=1121301 RepID=A0A1M6SEY2_PARC5|nr:Hsp20/alpha crystallin family protein [Paramaledivibacter caminithermalis]SHK43281.1 HSP20 family protein [Paramaledivibacter caminithermalis DSM 15212]